MKEDKEKSLDFAQLVVNTVRMIPVVGKPTNIVNAGGSLDSKDRIRSVAISMLGAIPIVGDVSNMISKGKRMLDPTKTLSEEFEAFLEDLPKGIYKKTITGASRKVISSERLAEMIQEKIKMLEFESARGCLSNTCFPGGTPILTQAGPIPIEQIKVGMLVNTQNPETGESGDQAVLSVSQTHVRKLFHIHVGKTEIKSTAMHRLYVQEKGFIPAQDLKVGDRLLGLKEGAPETFPIDQIAVQFYETPIIVYNFEVAAWHTYRVGEIGILVHNGKKTCSGKIPEPKKDENLILDLLGYYDIKEVITDIARKEVDLDTLKAGASLIPVAKITKVPKVVKAIGNVGKSGFKKGKEGEKIAKSSQAKQTKAKNKGGSKTGTWDMTEGGDVINGREYSQHAMERMAPDTPQVRAELSRRAEKAAKQLGYEVGSKEYYDFCKKYVDPRNIPPSVIENAIASTKAIAGNKSGTFVHETADVKVIVNSSGKVVTVIPK